MSMLPPRPCNRCQDELYQRQNLRDALWQLIADWRQASLGNERPSMTEMIGQLEQVLQVL